MSATKQPILVQSDFDGTLTIGDVSFLILDEFVGPAWREYLADYESGKISVNRFNRMIMAMVKADKVTLDQFVRDKVVIRPGFAELVNTCRELEFRFVIVSNGMEFYIETVLSMLGLENIEYKAAKAIFRSDGIDAWYEGPDGSHLDAEFKEAFTKQFIQQGYKTIYLGNGTSDFPPASMCNHIFSIDNLTACCRRYEVPHTPFNDLNEIAHSLKQIG
ncbi:MAG: HAD-IB family phosphatase [Dehalococcoidia bacterium]|nr:HAD-IB family phosphatase [Dehalococcoidia bacterium]